MQRAVQSQAAPTAPVPTEAPVAAAPAPAPVSAEAEMPTDFTGVDLFDMNEGRATQAPVVDAEVQALIDNLSPRAKSQLDAAGVDPSSLKLFGTDAEAEAAIARGELSPGDAYILPDGSVRVVPRN